MKKFIIKFTIFWTALLFFILCLELILRLCGFTVTHFRTNKDYALRMGQKKELTILAMGDSFTYAGNIDYSGSYPYQLYQLQSDNYPEGMKGFNIFNMARCGLNSAEIILLLHKGLQEVRPDVVLLLAGSADRYNFRLLDSNYQTKTSVKETILSQGQVELSQDLKDILTGLRVYKMAKIAYLAFKKKYLGWTNNLKHHFEAPALRLLYLKKILNIHNLERQGKHDQARSEYESIPKESREGLTLEEILNFPNVEYQKRKAYFHLTHSIYYHYAFTNDHVAAVQLCLDVLKMNPHLFADGVHFEFYLNRLNYHSAFQTKISSNMILQVIRKIAHAHLQGRARALLERSMAFYQNRSRIRQRIYENMKNNLRIMIDLIKQHEAVPVILTYPFSFTYENKFIREVAREKNTYLIDTEKYLGKIFGKHKRAELIQDDEHFTPLGYKYMAQGVYEGLKQADFMYRE